MCMEFSEVQNPLAARSASKYINTILSEHLNSFFDWWNFDIIPVLAEVITGDRDPYLYLVQSIVQFPNQVRADVCKPCTRMIINTFYRKSCCNASGTQDSNKPIMKA